MSTSGPRFAPNSGVWVSDEIEAWVEGKVVQQNDNNVVVRIGTGKTSHEVTVNSVDCFAKEEIKKGVDDMTKLAYLHEPGVLHNLHERYMLNQIYTYTGTILIAVNPFMRVPGLYGPVMKAQYQGSRLGDLTPHVFAIADHAYRAMRADACSQSVLISGESGAGKTETTKLVMEYLAGVGGRTSTHPEARSVEAQVLQSNPILEAFGNAKTVRNNNSSRFGKYIEIQFDGQGRVSGAAIKSYLLERSRVVQISNPERNYHCFYQLCEGASAEEVEMYKLPGTSKRAHLFRYLNQSTCFELEGESNVKEYANTKEAMEVLGFTQAEQRSVFGIVAAILHLGNVEFQEGVEGDTLLLKEGPSQNHLFCASELLSCDLESLKESLLTMTRKVAGEKVPLKSPLNAKNATSRRDSLSKNLYSTLFDWIVQKINLSIGVDETAEVSIGVLDIYGFEHFKVNSFEQFCINLANEKLQQHFNQHVLKMEQEEYEREEIDWSRIPFADNQDVLDLIEKDQGVLSVLDSFCKLQASTAEGFSRTLINKLSSHPRFSAPKFSKTEFTLEHYAGKVKYSTDEFLIKNIDAVVPEHHSVLSKSSNPFISSLFPEDKASSKNKFVSLGSNFKSQLGELMLRLSQTEPHYIRCVKPNSKLKPRILEKQLVVTQLRSGGVLEAVRMCSAGYPTRRTFEDFLDRFTLLAPMEVDPSLDERENVVRLLKKTNLENYQIGLTKVFLRAGQMVLLETMRIEKMNSAAKCIQRYTRLYLFRLNRSRAALVLQTFGRGLFELRKLGNLRYLQAAVKIETFVKGWLKRRAFLRLKNAVTYCQSLVRMNIEMKKYKKMRLDHFATVIQRYARGYIVRRPLRCLRHLVRGLIARKKFKKLLVDLARRSNLQFQADEAKRQASEAQSKALVGTLRYKVMQQLRDRAEKAKDLALQQLSVARQENENLRIVLSQKDDEIQNLQSILQDAQTQVEKVAQQVEDVIGEPKNISVKPTVVVRTSSILSPSLFPGSPLLSPSKDISVISPSPSPSQSQEIPPPVPSSEVIPIVTSSPSPQILQIPPTISSSDVPGVPPSSQILETPPITPSKDTSFVSSPSPSPAPSPSSSPSISLSSSQLPEIPSIRTPRRNTMSRSPLQSPLNRISETNPLFFVEKSIPPNQSSVRGKPTPSDFRRWSSVQIRDSSLTPIQNTYKTAMPRSGSTSVSETQGSKLLSRQVSRKGNSIETEIVNNLLSKVQNELGNSKNLKMEIQALRETKEEVERELEETKKLRERDGEILMTKETETKDLEGKIQILQDRLREKDSLEQEVKYLRRQFLALTAANRPELPPNKVPEFFLSIVGGNANLGYSKEGFPIAAVMVYKALLHWKTFETEKTNTFDQVVETFQEAHQGGNTNVQCYWLANTVILYHLAKSYRPKDVQQPLQFFQRLGWKAPEENTSTSMFKYQLEALIYTLFGVIRDSIKNELLVLLSGPAPEAPFPRSNTVAKKTSASYWVGTLVVLKQLFQTLQFNFVPPLLIHALFVQLLAFIDMRIFNSLIVQSQWCPCTYENGEIMGQGLARLLKWLSEVQTWLDDCLGPDTPILAEELCHLADVVAFLLCEQKSKKTVDNFRELCPNLSMNQLARICLWYEDEKYGTLGVDKSVIERMFSLVEDSSQLVIDEENSEDFVMGHLMSTLPEVKLDEIEPPSELQENSEFFFLNSENNSMVPSRARSVQSTAWPDAPAIPQYLSSPNSLSPRNLANPGLVGKLPSGRRQ